MATRFSSYGMAGPLTADALSSEITASDNAFDFTSNGDIKVIFHSAENGVPVRLELDPEYNISAADAVKIQVLVLSLSARVDPNDKMILQYIRLHNLERHFKISL